jgi:predicted ATPase/DNA-binding SARP family transcriptional activator
VERLVADLWPESEDRTTTSTVRTYVARLRNALPEDVVATRVGGYALDLSRVTIDAEHFEAQVRAAQSLLGHDAPAAAEHLREALGAWRGPAFAEVADLPWAQATATRLEDMRLVAVELQAEAELAAGGDPRDLAGRLAELTASHPLRERLWQHRMLALYRCGRQADALACYQDVRQHLADELGIEPRAELRELERAILTQDPALDGPSQVIRLDPPPPTVAPSEPALASNDGALSTSLVGRTHEVDEIRASLDQFPINTLIGPGGVGKSRLAREVVRALTDRTTVTVELSPISDRATMEDAVASAFGVARRSGLGLVELLQTAVAGSETTLILDNCEHLTDEIGDLLVAILPAAPSVRVLATSREPLHVQGERIIAVRPLAVPDDDAPIEEVRGAEAVRLFHDRASTVSPDFVLDDATARTVARICRRLDGLPFGIELAAARMRVLTPDDVEARLDERFALLTGGRGDARHGTLREAVAWSYDLLNDDERRAVRRLALFVDSFDIRGAAALFDVRRDDVVIDVVARLIDRSLLTAERRGERIRYRMLETVRAFALERLEDEGELVTARNLHAHHLAGLAAHAGRLLHGPGEAEGHAVLMTVRDDLRTAFEWAIVSGRWTDAARIVTSVPWERVGRSLQWDLSRWATRLLAEDPPLDVALATRLHAVATIGHWLAGESEQAHAVGRRALELAEKADEEVYVETALAVAWMLWEAGDIAEAAALYLPLADPSLGQKVGPDVAAYCLGGIVMGMTESGLAGEDNGDATAYVRSLTQAAIDLAHRSGSPAALAMAHLARAYSLLDSDPDAARAELQRVVTIRDLALPTWSLHARSHLARFRAAEGDHEGLTAELGDILATALVSVDEIHLRLIGGFVGGALSVAGMHDLAPTLRPLALEAFALPTADGWRREVASILGITENRQSATLLTGLELETAIRDAVSALTPAGMPAPSA